MNGHPRYYEIIEELKDIHSRKNHDYARDDDPLSNLKSSTRINIPPPIACWVRIQDKISRAEEYFKKGNFQVNESIHDTLNDLANYAILCRVLLEDEAKPVPVKEGEEQPVLQSNGAVTSPAAKQTPPPGKITPYGS